MKRGKRYVEAAKLVDRTTLYDAADAIALVKKSAVAKFDETVEAHIRTGCDGRHADQQIRGAVVLPHGTGKTVRILVFAKGPKADEALAAGADFVGAEELIPKIQNEGWLDFDVVVATPDMMGVVGRLGRVLGPKGLMPNPKAGTVTMDVTKAINDIKAGKIEYRLDKTNIIHVPVGKVSFTEEQLADNFQTLIDAIMKAKPSTVKGAYLKSVTLTSTMGPGVKADQQIRGAVVLPHGTGKTVRILVFAKGPKADEALAAGADFVGAEELIPKIQNEGWLDFDVVVATPDMMGVVGRLGRVLGPKGLMPNPKAGTVTMDVTKAINDIKAGKIEYRLDKTNIIHVPVGKVSFTEEQLADNFQTLIDAIMKAKPSTVKGAYLKSVTLTSTMGPGVKLNVAKLTN